MALSTARMHKVRGRPPLLAAGISSFIHSHSSSVRSLGYVCSFILLLPIRPINFQYPEFQAVDREKYLTPDIAGCPPAPLTRVSTDAGFPLRRPALSLQRH